MRYMAIALFASHLAWAGGTAARTTEPTDVITHVVTPVETPREDIEALKDLFQGPQKNSITDFDFPGVSVVISVIMNIGEKVWSVIEKNKPVVNISYKYANALPKGVHSAEDLDEFSDMQFHSFRLYGKNLMGMTPYDVTLTLAHRYGGNYQGKGAYVDTATVLPHVDSVAWGYNVNVNVNSISTANVGTKDAPVASLVMELDFKVSTVLKSYEYRNIYEFRGDAADVKSIEN